ncbi:MAG: hypothetical protein WBH51_07820 [Mycolicibacter algericus]|uniref:hypothetical protein n=1 Tax=Mycolicibacter algericus TaxID=1288388 RepID=UPI003C72E3D3
MVRLLRITTDAPAVEATSTRCQAVLEAFRGRAEAARRMIDSARRTVTELGLRHALLEVEQFAGIVELVVDEAAAAEPYLRQAYRGFRRMGLDADTAETAALLGRACLALDQDAEAAELCSESERLAGHALKASIAWRTLRALLLARRGEHAEARQVAEAAVGLAERTDGLVDHGDACLALATVLNAAGDEVGARAAAERAVDLYERKGAAALAEKARLALGERVPPPAADRPEEPAVELDTAAVRVGEHVMAAIHRKAWDEFERLFAPDLVVESRRKVVGLSLPSDAVRLVMRRELEAGAQIDHAMIAARGERLALSHMITTIPDARPGAPQDELLQLYGIDEEGRVTLQIWFDVDDMDAAIAELDAAYARLEGERVPARLENAAARVYRRNLAHYAARDWDALSKTFAQNIVEDDRRRVANAGLRRGRDAVTAGNRALAELGVTFALDTIATRGERLALSHGRASAGQPPDDFHGDFLDVAEIDADEQVVAHVIFEADDFEAAIAELDTRYLAGEAATYAQTWSALTQTYAAANRKQLQLTPDCVNIDHRRLATIETGHLAAYLRSSWDDAQNFVVYIEAVHRLSARGAVFTQAARGTSDRGFDAEWREVIVATFDGDLVNRTEVFDGSDLDAALARFDQLSAPVRRLENAASQAYEHFRAYFATRDWDAMAELLTVDTSVYDHRRVVNAEIQRGRDGEIANMQAFADIDATRSTSMVLATRGERLVLCRTCISDEDHQAGGFRIELLIVVETNADKRILARVAYDPDDIDAAFGELETRYLAGEAAAFAHTWSVIAQIYAAYNRHELPAADWINVDHRRSTPFATGDVTAVIRAWRELTPDFSMHIEAVHRLNNFGAVITHTSSGTSQEGFDAEWRQIQLLTVEGDRINRCEIFDEADLDAALARFDELSAQTRQLENAATRACAHAADAYNRRDGAALFALTSADSRLDDRRKGLRDTHEGAEVQKVVAVTLETTPGSWRMEIRPIATRGSRLALTRRSYRDSDDPDQAVTVDLLSVVEVGADGLMNHTVTFDPEDFDAAVAELDARYLAGEAAAHAHTWSIVMGAYAALNRHEIAPTTPDWVNIDHRRGAAFEPGDMVPYLQAAWDDSPDTRMYIAAVHRLSDIGAVITHVARGISQDGFDAEWRDVTLMTLDGDSFDRSELFNEADLDAALARFETVHAHDAEINAKGAASALD